MRLSLAWLNELLGTQHEAAPLARLLTHAGLVVDEIHPAPDGDTTLVAEVTTNRPDWLGHWGVAREIAALTGATFTPPTIAPPETGPDVHTLSAVIVEEDARRFCPRYTARVLRGVTIKPSPEWLQRRLESIGQRPINNIVDVTNLICFEMNQPLHAFDLDQLAGRRIVVRMARDGEPFAAITGESGVLTRDRLVIADTEKPVALAGVKGGVNSGVTETTRDLLIESAWFDPAQVRRSGRALKMASESSHRFERGVDPGTVERAGARAAQLMQALAGGVLATGVIDTNPGLAHPWSVSLRFGRCAALLGHAFPEDEIVAILTGLGLRVQHRDAAGLTLEVPTCRQDLTREIDLVEEVARVGGYDRIGERVNGLPLTMATIDPMTETRRGVREVLAGLGYHECFCDAFIPEGWAEPFADPAAGVAYRIQNPVNAERPLLRTSLCPSLLEVRRINRAEASARLFEINRTYHKTADGPREHIRLALLDDRGPEYVRGALEAAVEFLKRADPVGLTVPETATATERTGFAPGTMASMMLGENVLADFGRVTDAEAARHNLATAPGMLEADLAVLAAAPKRSRWYRPPARFPSMRRDIALVTPEATRWGEVEAVARGVVAGGTLESLRLESVYRGKGLEEGEKSIAFAMTLRSPEGSLTDETANDIRDAVITALRARFPGSRLR